ncbi:hypothetical protein KO505_12845 [Psychrosphaera sp. F3M07]|uniref:hypothetical protein n=1 Tax=Psychrosphaera sp. F3M07 TaxID=2841560 RepID=UPI001C0957CE|nr:hypothetical protein [Psychrosphaera sp. F3M07]MBU2918836.1 hypothetical protein [Psychrosphaera sp. F3M07]
MKTIKTNRVLLVSSILAALAGCNVENPEYDPEAMGNSVAPTHGGDIVVDIHEKNVFKQYNLLGSIAGENTGESIAKDADGNYLSVTDITITTSGDRIEDIGSDGILIQGNTVGVRALDIAPNLDTDETHTVVLTYNITDGVNKTPRTATFNITGEDFAPVITGGLLGNFTRDAGASVLDGLKNVTDADNEVLTLSNLVADSANPFNLPVTINGTNLDVDVSAVESSIPDGQKVTFNFTYTVSDHRFDQTRNLTINVLGVQDITGAPLVLNYFKTDKFDETDGLKVYNLADEIEEREGDDVVISDVMLDGSAELPFGVKFEGTTLTFNPNAFYDDIAANSFKDFVFTYKVADSNGNMSDGTAELKLTVDGVESNILKANGADVSFENGGTGFDLFNCVPGIEITDAIVANGEHSMQMLGAPCYVNVGAQYFPDLASNQKYYLSYNAYVGNGDASPYIMISNDPNGTHNFWQGARPWHPANGSWRPLMINYDTNAGYLATANADGEKPTDIGDQLQLFIMSAWVGNDGMPVFDDFNMVRYDNLEGVDLLNNNEGTFEAADYAPTTSGGGTVEVQTDANNADNKVLYVDTTGADAGGVKVEFAVPKGAIVSGGKYRVTFDIQYVNFEENKAAGTDPNINQWGGYALDVVFANGDSDLNFTLNNTIWNGAGVGQVQGIADETTHWFGFGANTDWNSDNVTATFVIKGIGAKYIIDNIKIDRVP